MPRESKWTTPTRACPHPEHWSAPNGLTTETEVSRLVGAMVEALHPELAIETGTGDAQTTVLIGKALATVPGHGHLITYEVDPDRVTRAREKVTGLRVDVQQRSSLEGLTALAADIHAEKMPRVGFAWLDSLFSLRHKELEIITPVLAPGAIVGIHDCGQPRAAKYRQHSQRIADTAERLGYARISLPTPRGVTFLSQKAWW